MARKSVPVINTDFEEVLEYLKEVGLLRANPRTELVEQSRRVHRVTYALILWRFRLEGLPEHGQCFIEEIASDALQLLPQIVLGFQKTVKLLARGIVENTLRHIYFSDHPVEFLRMNLDNKWHISAAELFEYVRDHPRFISLERQFDALNRLKVLYQELSAGVHGRSVADLEMRVALTKIVYDHSQATKQVELLEKCAESANFLLAVFNSTQMERFGSVDQRIILQTMCPRARTVWRDMSG